MRSNANSIYQIIYLLVTINKGMKLNIIDESIKIEYKPYCFQAIEKISMQRVSNQCRIFLI